MITLSVADLLFAALFDFHLDLEADLDIALDLDPAMTPSVADLLLAVFCMPFTLIPTLLQNFIFGPVVCVLVRYMQGELAPSLLATRSLAENHEMTVIRVEVLHYFVKILQGASLALSIPLTHHGCCYRSD